MGEHESNTEANTELLESTQALGAGVRVGIYLGAGSVGAAAGVVAAASEQLPAIVTIVAGSIAAACTFLVAGVAASNVNR